MGTTTDVGRLTAPFKPTEIKFKPQSVKGNRALALAYIDCRLIQDRLDDVLGVENWMDEYEILADGSVMCLLKLRINGEWVTKVDVGSPSEQPDVGDRLKAAFSDAMKRAAVKFGIGRYLYRLPAVWCDYDPQKRAFSGTPQLPAWAIPKGDKPKPHQFTTAADLVAAMAAKETPLNGVSLAERVNWCDKELARLMPAFKAGSLVDFALAAAKVATFQQLSGLPAGELVGSVWLGVLDRCRKLTAPPADAKAAGLDHQTLRELIEWAETAVVPDGAERLRNRVVYIESKLAALCPPALHYREAEFSKSVCSFAKVISAQDLKLLEQQKDVAATWANAVQFVKRIKEQAVKLAADAKSPSR